MFLYLTYYHWLKSLLLSILLSLRIEERFIKEVGRMWKQIPPLSLSIVHCFREALFPCPCVFFLTLNVWMGHPAMYLSLPFTSHALFCLRQKLRSTDWSLAMWWTENHWRALEEQAPIDDQYFQGPVSKHTARGMLGIQGRRGEHI